MSERIRRLIDQEWWKQTWRLSLMTDQIIEELRRLEVPR